MGYSASLGVGRYSPSELSALYVPRSVDTAKRAIIYAHGAGGDGSQPLDATNQRGVYNNIIALVNAGFIVLSGDFGGAQTFGNDTELAAMEGAWSYLQTSGLCATDKVILTGASMGFMSISRFAKEHPTQSAGMIGWIPAIDIEEMRISDAIGLRDLINAAWGLTAGSTSQSVSPPASTVPVRGRPLDSANLAAVASVPTHLWYSSGDTVTKPSGVTAYVAGRANATAHLCSSAEHSDAAIIAADVSATVEFAEAIA